MAATDTSTGYTYWSQDPSCRDSPQSASSQGLAASIVLSGQVRVYGFTAYSSKASAQWILMFDASALPANAAVPICAFNVGAQALCSAYYGEMGRVFHQGLVLCTSSSDTTKTLASADTLFDVQLDYLY